MTHDWWVEEVDVMSVAILVVTVAAMVAALLLF
jgi:hypothetical protein